MTAATSGRMRPGAATDPARSRRADPPAPGARRRIALFLPNLAAGGAETSMLRTAGELLYRGFRVDLVLCERSGPLQGDVPSEVRVIELSPAPMLVARAWALAADPAGFRALLAPILLAWRPLHRLPHLPSLVRYLRTERPDALFSAMPTPNLLAVWARRQAAVPTCVVISEQNTLSVRIDGSRKWRDRFLPQLLDHAYRMADGIVAISDGVADDLAVRTGLPRARITTVYSSVITSDLVARANQPLDHPWFAPGEPPVILAAGRLHPQKDFATLIRAFARLRAKRPARLVILGAEASGDAAYAADLKALPALLGVAQDVDMPGFSHDILAYMSHAAVFVLSSAYEGLGLVLIEALACGTPVVSTDCPSGPREILEHGRYGALVPVGDDASMAAAIETALDDPVPADLLRSRSKAFSAERAVERYLSLMFGEQDAHRDSSATSDRSLIS